MTSKATIGSAAKERNGLSPKDFVFIAVFGILFVPSVHGVLDYL